MINSEYQRFKTQHSSQKRLSPTSADIEGPFYREGAPFLENGDLDLHEGAKPFVLQGTVRDIFDRPISGARLDFWQANEKGEYDNAGYHLRGEVETDYGGRYRLLTIVPGDYKISDTEFRCAHIHVKVRVEGKLILTTQLYFPNDPHNATDHWFDQSRVINVDQRAGGNFDFVIDRSR